jgi:8-oxo-dGTP pyrophosphatase MutT (NUDIX family)
MKQAQALEHAGFPAEGIIFPVRSLNLPVITGEHPWVTENRPGIAENWAAEIGRNPALYDGQMVFQRQLSLIDGNIAGEAQMIGFSAFLHWRRQEPRHGGFHLFGIPVLFSSDGALIAIRMSQKTANPGRVYFAAGSMDADDVIDGRCDVDFNMQREVMEETGLDLRKARVDPNYFGIHDARAVTIFRIFRFDLTEREMLNRIAAHIATDPDPEISNAVAIRSADPSAHDYAPFMPPLLAWLLDQ